MISSAEFASYNRAVARIGDKAASDVESSVLAWCRANASATVAEKREAAKLIMDGYIQGYDDIAAEFAAEWYDHRAQKSGVALDQAITMTTYKPECVDDVARYQAKKLAKGGDAEFAKACGEFARNDAFRSLNETIIANVGRDRDKGARFARVPTGFETCTFCLMLASRGAVYHTRKSAGEFKHFHRGCDCKVVPSFERDPYAEVVEGVKPRELQERWKQFVDIDNSPGLTELEKRLLKGRFGKSGRISKERGAKPWRKEISAAEILVACGVDISFIKETKRAKTPDAYLDGVVYEFKIPDSMGDKTIKNQMKKATGKGTGNLLLSNIANGASDSEFLRAIERFLSDDEYKEDFEEIKRILFVGREGTIKEFKR